MLSGFLFGEQHSSFFLCFVGLGQSPFHVGQILELIYVDIFLKDDVSIFPVVDTKKMCDFLQK